MKLDKIKFARLVGIITHIANRTLDEDEIDVINHVAEVVMPAADVIHPASSDISQLMFLMQQSTQKIEAIKLHRKLTGWGLKESKEEVEKYWTAKPVGAPVDHTLGDILAKATK